MLFAIPLLIAAAISYYAWRRDKDKPHLYYLILYTLSVAMIVWEYLTKSVLHLSSQAALINRYGIFCFWIFAGIIFLVIVVKESKKKKNKTQ